MFVPLLTSYQKSVIRSLKKLDIQRVSKLIGKCHDAFIGEWINWWFARKGDIRICNPARAARAGSRTYIADLLFLERFQGEEYYEVKGVAEVENDEEKFIEKIKSLSSYEKYTRKGTKAYPNLEFAILCYTIKTPNDDLSQRIYDAVLSSSEYSELLWIIGEVGKSLTNLDTVDYSIYMPLYVKGAELFYYNRRIDSFSIYTVKNGKQIRNVVIPGITR